MTFVVFTLIGFTVFHAFRQYTARKTQPQVCRAHFDGRVFKVGDTYIAKRPLRDGSTRSIVCFPGFLEDMRYFQNLYEDDPSELILFNNADYHCPFIAEGEDVPELVWPDNPYPVGSIEHDAFYVGQSVLSMVSCNEIVLHGHSRGGAVILEMGRQYQGLEALGKAIHAVLEAPVLPQAKVAGPGSKKIFHSLVCYLLPLLFASRRVITLDRLLRMPMMTPTNALKTRLMSSIFLVARRYDTCAKNVKSIFRWQRLAGFELYGYFQKLTVVVGECDSSLDRKSMLASVVEGAKVNPGVELLETQSTNHFISLEQPATMRQLLNQSPSN